MLIFVSFSGIFNISKFPPLHLDELNQANVAVKILRSGIMDVLFFPFFDGENIFHFYAMMPALYFFGHSIIALRITSFIFGVLTWLFTYLFAKKFYNRKTAFFSSFVLALLPPFFVFSRYNMEPIFLPFFTALTLYLLSEYEEKGKKRFLYLSALACGFGVMTRIDFIFFIISLFLMSKIGLVFEKLKKIGKRDVVVAFLIFLFGCFPIIIGNIRDDFSLFRRMLERFPKTSHGNADMGNIVGNLKSGLLERIPTFFAGGDDVHSLILAQLHLPFIFDFFLILFLISFGFLMFIHVKERKINSNFKKDLFVIINILVFFIILSIIARTLFFSDKYTIILPLCAMVIGRAFYYMSKISKVRYIVFIPLFTIFSLIGMFGIYKFVFLVSLNSEDKCMAGVEKLADSLLNLNHLKSVINSFQMHYFTLEWILGKQNHYDYLESNLSLRIDTFDNCDEYERLVKIGNNETLFIFGSEQCPDGCKTEFLKLGDKYNKPVTLEDKIYSNGSLLFVIYRV